MVQDQKTKVRLEGMKVLESTGKFKVKSIIFDNGEFAIARGHWDGGLRLSTACRWHEKDGIGYPQTFGKPQWMLLPDPGVQIDAEQGTDSPLVKLAFGKIGEPFYSLEFIDLASGEGVHTLTSRAPFGPVAVGDFVSLPGAKFPDELTSKNGRLVTGIQHIINEVNGMAWHSTRITVEPPNI